MKSRQSCKAISTSPAPVLIEFPSAEQAMAWMTSPEYQEIAQHRLEASVGNAIMVKKLEMDEVEERLAEKG